ncbi:hypothetical protein ACP70R_046892 [Stipagrostis hirtigluma subsp. patula]
MESAPASVQWRRLRVAGRGERVVAATVRGARCPFDEMCH